MAIDLKRSKEDISTYFNDGLRKIDFVLVYQDGKVRGGQQEGDASPGVLAAAQAFK